MEHIRVDYALITQALEHAALLLQMPQAQLFLKVARFNNCLLYTSDAADE